MEEIREVKYARNITHIQYTGETIHGDFELIEEELNVPNSICVQSGNLFTVTVSSTIRLVGRYGH